MTTVLRQAVRSDVPGLFRVRRAVSENSLLSLAIPDAQLVEALETTGRGWVIEVEGVIVAFALGDALTGSIWALFVDPPHRGRGYGRRLHDTVVEWLWSQGHDRIWLNAEPDRQLDAAKSLAREPDAAPIEHAVSTSAIYLK